MAQAEIQKVLPVDREKLLSVITRYEDYPKFVEGCQGAQVERLGEGKARVQYQVSVMSQEVKYTLDHFE